jgi:transposase-like protein
VAGRLETIQTGGMKPPPSPRYRHRLPVEIISHAFWLCHVFSVSFRDVQFLLVERGHCRLPGDRSTLVKKTGQSFANCLCHPRLRPGDKWHLGEVFIQIQAIRHYLWRAVNETVLRKPLSDLVIARQPIGSLQFGDQADSGARIRRR